MPSKFDTSFWVSILVLAALAVVAGAVIMIWRARAMGRGGDSSHELLSESLRRMHAEGRLSDEEYKAAKRGLVERTLAEQARASERTNRDGFIPPDTEGQTPQTDQKAGGTDRAE